MNAAALAFRARAHLGAKLLMALALHLAVGLPYFVLQRTPVFPVTWMPEVGVERLVPFDERATWLYLSLFVFILLPPLFMRHAADLRRYATGMLLIAVTSHTLFFLLPTAVARPEGIAADLAYRLVRAADTPLNACPSLHASLAVYSALWASCLLSRGWQPVRWHILTWSWTAAILYATLATRQHVLLDLLGGATLALAVFRGAVRLSFATARAAEEAIRSIRRAHAQARATMAAAIRDELPALRRLSVRKTAEEILLAALLWCVGAAVAVAASHGAAGALRWAAVVGGIACAALGLNALVLLMHEGIHHTLFPSRSWNRWVAAALGATFLMSFSAWRVLHLRHHAYLGDPRDPDDYHNYAHSRHAVWLMHVLRLLIASFLYILAIPILAFRYGTPAARRRIAVEYLALAAVYALVAAVVPRTALLYGWLLPLVVVAYLTNVRGLSQHSLAVATDPYLATRTMRVHPAIAFCLLNENYHLEHHFFPDVPGYNLRMVHTLCWHHLPRAIVGTSYLAFLASFLRATLSLVEAPIGITYPAREAGAASAAAAVDALATLAP